jgi:hypothetical protein
MISTMNAPSHAATRSRSLAEYLNGYGMILVPQTIDQVSQLTIVLVTSTNGLPKPQVSAKSRVLEPDTPDAHRCWRRRAGEPR